VETPDLGLWRSLTGVVLAGRTTTDLTIAGTLDQGLDADAALHADDLVTHLPVADALLGGRLVGSLHARRQPDGRIDIPAFELDAAALRVHGNGALDGDAAHSDVQIELPRLTPLGKALGVALRGRAAARLQIARSPVALTARLTAEADPNGVATRLAGKAVLDDAHLAIDDARLEAAGTRVTGQARLARATGLVDGTLAIAAPDLKPLSVLAGTPVSGRARGHARFAADRAGQHVALTLDAGNVIVGGVTVAQTEFKVAGRTDAATWSVRARGEAGRPFSIDADGQLAHRTESDRITVQRLTGAFAAVPVRLEQATSFERTAASLALGATRLDIGHGRVHVDASRRGETLSGAIEIDGLPLATIGAVAPVAVTGRLDARAHLAGTLAAPTADLTVDLRHVMSAHDRAQAVDGEMTAQWHGRQAILQGRLTGLGDHPLDVSAHVPVVYRSSPLDIGMAQDAPIDAHVDGAIELGRIMDALGIDQPVSGRIALDLSVAGTLTRPRVSGSAELADGHYADPTSGIVADAITAKLVADGAHVALTDLSATDGAGGRLSGSGAADLAGAHPSFQGTATLSKFAIRRDDVAGVADASLRFTGGAQGYRVDGSARIGKTEIAIPDQLPISLVNIKVIEINGKSPTSQPAPGAGAPSGLALPITLALTVDLPGPVLVRGRGLNSQWQGRLTVGGTAAAPAIQGSLTLVHGSINFLGKQLSLTDGKIDFPGNGGITPHLDITATATATDLTATIRMTGPATKPTLSVSSDPPLPQDEILAHVLFDKGTTQLSATEAVELAQAVAQLTGGGGGGIVDRIRKATGLDVIDLTSTQDKSGSSAQALSVGKYVGNGVLVTGEQGVTPGTTRAGVEVNVIDHFSVKTDVGADSDSSIGLTWKHDY
ncbi:MAG TPA: translocation/assembly module TamB domain-containing protein, partial [Candidatus Sulfotelmatobacter sp.]|nr:translocation/assembly module TamB domain-containing protein [Candidatus Sulfotelmatobacter sp.]